MLRGIREKWQEYNDRREQNRLEAAERDRLAREREEEKRREEEEQARLALERQLEWERRKQEWREKVLAIIEDGKVPEMDIQEESVPFKLQRMERMLLTMDYVPYSEMRVKREIIGRSAGTSVRVAKGVSVRVGASRGTPVETDVLTPRGYGLFGLSTKHVFFNGERTFRIPISKIVSAQVVNVGLEIVRDRVSAQPEFFGMSEDDAEWVVDLIHAIEDADYGRRKPVMQEVHSYLLMDGDGDDVLYDDC